MPKNLDVLFVAGFGPIVRDPAASRRLYVETLGLPFKEDASADLPVPHAWIEFDVANIDQATAELQSQGYHLLVATRTEPWGQIVTRLLGPEGLLVGTTHTPSMRK